jgi:hypothetical protein
MNNIAYAGGTFLASGDGGRFMSSEDGVTFTDRTGAVAEDFDYIDANPDSNVFIATSTSGSVIKSFNKGRTLIDITSRLPPTDVGNPDGQVGYVAKANMWIITPNNAFTDVEPMWFSYDDGETWDVVHFVGGGFDRIRFVIAYDKIYYMDAFVAQAVRPTLLF